MVLLGDLSDAARLESYDAWKACRQTTAEAYIKFGCGVSLFRTHHLIVKTSKKPLTWLGLHILGTFANLLPVTPFTLSIFQTPL
jgi:hypothetical protein